MSREERRAIELALKDIDPAAVGWQLGKDLPDPTSNAIQSRPAVAAAEATRALKSLAECETTMLLAHASQDDYDAFIDTFGQQRKRLILLEPLVQHFRGEWARVNAQSLNIHIEIMGAHFSSAHLCLYCWCRAIRFAVWAAADAKKLLDAGASKAVDLEPSDIRRKWASVRKVLSRPDWKGFVVLNVQVEAERDLLIGNQQSGGAVGIPLNATDKKILIALFNCDPVSQQIYDLEAGIRVSRKTISEAVKKLEEAKYVHRPDGPRKGIAITATGVAIAEKLPR